jgi:hypothetical protein
VKSDVGFAGFSWRNGTLSESPEAADEYDLYIGDIFELLERGGSVAKISDYLRNIEVDRMGMIDAAGEPLLAEARRGATVSSLTDLRGYFARPS